VLIALERDSPTIPIRVTRIIVATQRPGATSPYSTFAKAVFAGLDSQGNALDSIIGVLARSKRFKAWTLIGYGSSDVACDQSEAALFGGRRSAIYGDLGIRCGG